jgi:uncharacterized membrane protein SirB2
MIEFYPEIRAVHIAAVLTSGGLFLIRALAWNAFDARWAMAAPLRWLAWTIDTVLLTAALMLMAIIHQDPIKDSWLTVKLSLLVAYILLGYYALRAATRPRRWAFLAAAALAFGYIYTVARAHDPLGLFA